MNTLAIKGGRLRDLAEKRGVRQVDVCAWTGVSKYNVSRWFKNGANSNIKKPSVIAMSRGMGISFEKFLEECGVREVHISVEDRLSPAEAELLDVFRACTELEKARIRVAIHELTSIGV